MKRVVIFAHFDKYNIIDPYVITYLEELKKYSEIIFVSDGNLQKDEITKIIDLCFDNICQKHGEYDFGSYKRGFKLLKEKYPEKFNKLDEVLFVNDSCYLVGTFDKVFSNAEEKTEVDFWGLTDCYDNFINDYDYHIQSYFLSFRRSVFLDQKFQKFIVDIKRLKHKDDIIIEYEFGLSKFLFLEGKKGKAIFGTKNVDIYIANNKRSLAKELLHIVTKELKIKKSNPDIWRKNNAIYNRWDIYRSEGGHIFIHNIINSVTDLNTLNYSHRNKYIVLLKMGIPVVKIRIIKKGFTSHEALLFFWKKIITKYTKYNVRNIINHCSRIDLETKKYIDLFEKAIVKSDNNNIYKSKLFNLSVKNSIIRVNFLGIRIIKHKLEK